MDVEVAVRSLLLAEAAVAAVVSTRIYTEPIPQSPTTPYLAITEISNRHLAGSSDGPGGLESVRIQIDAVASTRALALSLSEMVFAALCPDLHRGDRRTFGGVEMQDITEGGVRRPDYDPDTRLFWRMRDYLVIAAAAA